MRFLIGLLVLVSLCLTFYGWVRQIYYAPYQQQSAILKNHPDLSTASTQQFDYGPFELFMREKFWSDREDWSRVTAVAINDDTQLKGLPDSLQHLKWLEVLESYNSKIDDEFCIAVSKVCNLRTLKLRFTEDVTSRGLAPIIKTESLKLLYLTHYPSVDHLIPGLVAKPITAINANGDLQISKQFIVMINSETRLRQLSITDNKYLADKNIEHLFANRFELKDLDISKTPITDAAVEHLVKLKNLRILDVTHTNISRDGYVRLKEKMKVCEIKYRYACDEHGKNSYSFDNIAREASEKSTSLTCCYFAN